MDSRATNYYSERLAAAATFSTEEFITKLAGRKTSMIDVSQSFFNIPLHPESYKHFSFLDPEKRVLQLTRASQGHHNSPAFQHLAMRYMLDQKGETNEVEQWTPAQAAIGEIGANTNLELLPPGQLPTDDDEITIFNIWDDLAVATKQTGGHRIHREALQLLFNKIRKANMKLRIEKLQLCPKIITIMGMTFDSLNLKIPTKRFQAFKEMKTDTPRRVKSFVASLAYYRSFCPNFTNMALPLMRASHLPEKEFKWTPELQQAKDNLITHMEKHHTRRVVTWQDKLILSTDSSKECAAATLEVATEDGLKLVKSFSKIYSKHEKNHNIFAKEAATIVAAINHFQYYLKGAKDLTLRTDVKAFAYIKQTELKNAVSFRLASEISKYDFKIIHVPTHAHLIPDTLSRHNTSEKEEEESDSISAEEAAILLKRIHVESGKSFTKQEALQLLGKETLQTIIKTKSSHKAREFKIPLPEKAPKHTINKPNFVHKSKATEEGKWREHFPKTKPKEKRNITISHMEALQEEDEKTEDTDENIILFLAFHEIATQGGITKDTFRKLQESDSIIRKFIEEKQTSLSNGIWKKTSPLGPRILLPTRLLETAIRSAHTQKGFHRDRKATKTKIAGLFYHPHLDREILRITEACIICNLGGNKVTQKPPLSEMLQATKPGEIFYIDIMDMSTQLKQKGYRYALIAVDEFSQYITAVPMTSRETNEVIQAIASAITIPFGPPKVIVSDNESAIKSTQCENFMDFCGTQLTFTSPHSPWTNKAERAIRKIKTIMRTDEDQLKNWNQKLTVIIDIINNQPLEQSLASPADILFRNKYNSEIWNNIKGSKTEEQIIQYTNIRRAKAEKIREHRNKHRKDREFEIGQIVQVKQPIIRAGKSLFAKPEGIFIVERKLNAGSFELTNISTRARVQRHKAYIYPTSLGTEPEFPSQWEGKLLPEEEGKERIKHDER